jgi:PAS domain S-box-containing protein
VNLPSTDTTTAELLFRAITEAADNANIGVIVVRLGASESSVDLVYLNRATEQIAGCTRDEIRARGFWAFIPKSELARVQAIQAARLHGAEVPRMLHTQIVQRDGLLVPVEVALGTVTLEDAPALVIFVNDISARKAAEDALRRSETLFQQVVTHAPDAIFVFRWPFVAFANPAGARVLEFERGEDVVGLNIAERLTPEGRQLADERLRRHNNGTYKLEPLEYRGVNPAGSQFALEVSSLPIHFDGEPGVLAFARDMTERNLILAKLRAAEKLAAVNALAAGVAHEINNPLAYVLLNLEFMERELPELGGDTRRTEALQRRLEDTRQGAERVKNIVRDLQALTRKDEDIRGAIELDQVIEHALGQAKRELHNRITVRTHFEKSACVLGNPTRLEQLFYNLLINAAHALSELAPERRTIRITLSCRAGRVLTEVSDNGCGMSAQVLARAFDPFFTTKPLGVGAGLGLSICKRIVDDLGGQIQIDSTEAVGTTVRVSLPECEPSGVRPASTRRGHLLLVDDERAVAESLRHMLQDDHEVDVATSVREARALLEERHDYDVVLCDLAMPVESGADLYAYALDHYPALAQRFVFMTGGAFTTRAASFLEDSQRPHVEKPFDLESLRALIADLVERGPEP